MRDKAGTRDAFWTKVAISPLCSSPKRAVTTHRTGSSTEPALFAVLVAFVADARAVTINWVSVGSSGNPADTVVMTSDGTTGYGSIGYNYNIGKYDVTNAQYAEFLNSNDPTGANALGLYHSAGMADPDYGGISYNSAAVSGSKYSIIPGNGNHPVNFVSWYDGARFANWLNNGQVAGATETGAYTFGPLDISGEPINGETITRNPGATIVLASENEWYKAAYFNPATNSYFKYPTSSDTAPTADIPSATPNTANFASAVRAPTDVGAYTGTTSPFGAFDMAGNLEQWLEPSADDKTRGFRSTSYGSGSFQMLSSARDSIDPRRGFNVQTAGMPLRRRTDGGRPLKNGDDAGLAKGEWSQPMKSCLHLVTRAPRRAA